jgi:hypothetical protein
MVEIRELSVHPTVEVVGVLAVIVAVLVHN